MCTSIFWDLKQFWCQTPHPSIDIGSSAVFIRFVLDVALQEDLELLELLRHVGRAAGIELTARRPESLEVLVVPVESFPRQTYLRNIRWFQLPIRILSEFWWSLASCSDLVHNSLRYRSRTRLYWPQRLCIAQLVFLLHDRSMIMACVYIYMYRRRTCFGEFLSADSVEKQHFFVVFLENGVGFPLGTAPSRRRWEWIFGAVDRAPPLRWIFRRRSDREVVSIYLSLIVFSH